MSSPLLAAAAPLLLVAARVWAMLRVQPVWRLAVGPWWEVVAAALALALAAPLSPATPALGDTLGWTLLGAVGAELVVGTVLGLLAGLPAYALLGGAGASAAVVGLRKNPRTLVALTCFVALTTTLALGLHRPLLAASLDTLALVPIGTAPWALVETTLQPAMLQALHAMLTLGLALATPALLAGALAELAARALAKGPAPTDALDAWAPWLRLAAALLALTASWTAYTEAWTRPLLPTG